jgi:hypothetical protein
MDSDLIVVVKVHDDEEKVDKEPPETIPPKGGEKSLKSADKKTMAGRASMAPRVSSKRFNPRDISSIESWPSNDVHVFTSPIPRQREKAPGHAFGWLPQGQFSRGPDPYQGFKSYNDSQHYENASVTFRNHPSGPFMSCLNANLAETIKDSMQDVVKQVSFRYSCISSPFYGLMASMVAVYGRASQGFTAGIGQWTFRFFMSF